MRGRAGKELPVDPERLKVEFPELTGEDLEAYVQITKRVLADPAAKGRIMREIMTSAQKAREKAATGGALHAQELLALRYWQAVQKMQRSTVHKPH